MRILITGSEGLIGKIISDYLKENRQELLVELDKNNQKNPVNLLRDNIIPYFKDVNTLIHLAANADPTIGKKEAEKNIKIAKKIIEACENSKTIERIINASSINVYPYIDIFESGGKITKETPLSPNKRWSKGEYGQAKIEVEKLFEEYCRKNNIFLLNLRIGCVTKNNLPNRQEDGHIELVDYDIHLKHEDLIKIIKESFDYKGIGSYVCVSKKDGFIDNSIRFPI